MEKLTLKSEYDAIIIGGGAAGLFCAGQAGLRGKRVLVLEHNEKTGAKILISGGGRCNFTNSDIRPECFIGENPSFARSALSAFSQNDFIKLVEEYKIPYYEKDNNGKKLGQLFVDGVGGAKQILAMLLDICAKSKVEIKTGIEIISISKNENYIIRTKNFEYSAPNLIIATGGKSIPKMGATGFAYDVAHQFGIHTTQTNAGLVPMIFTGSKYDWINNLAGTAADIEVSFKKRKFNEAMLFTHRGISGPAILQISNYYEKGAPIYINFAPEYDFERDFLKTKQMRPNQQLSVTLARKLPQKLAKTLCTLQNIDRPLQEIKNSELCVFATLLHNYPLIPAGDEGYAKAEVTKGGIDTKELNQKTMECKNQKGLYFIGECVDITGWLGGYNFAWAWSSAYACAIAL